MAYTHGFRAGVEYARAAMDAAIREAIDPGPTVNPFARMAVLDRTAKAVVKSLVDAIRRDDMQPTAPPVCLDYKGGAAAWKDAA